MAIFSKMILAATGAAALDHDHYNRDNSLSLREKINRNAQEKALREKKNRKAEKKLKLLELKRMEKNKSAQQSATNNTDGDTKPGGLQLNKQAASMDGLKLDHGDKLDTNEVGGDKLDTNELKPGELPPKEEELARDLKANETDDKAFTLKKLKGNKKLTQKVEELQNVNEKQKVLDKIEGGKSKWAEETADNLKLAKVPEEKSDDDK